MLPSELEHTCGPLHRLAVTHTYTPYTLKHGKHRSFFYLPAVFIADKTTIFSFTAVCFDILLIAKFPLSLTHTHTLSSGKM